TARSPAARPRCPRAGGRTSRAEPTRAGGCRTKTRARSWARTWAQTEPLGRPRLRPCRLETPLRLGIRVGGQWPFLQDFDVVAGMIRIDRADDVRVQIGMREREAQDELHRRHAAEQIVEPHLLPAVPLHALVLALRRRPLRRATADHDAGARRGGLGD